MPILFRLMFNLFLHHMNPINTNQEDGKTLGVCLCTCLAAVIFLWVKVVLRCFSEVYKSIK